jgi:streptogramin lyase
VVHRRRDRQHRAGHPGRRGDDVTAGISAGARHAGIAAGPDGNVWFADYAGDRIGRITPGGAVTEFSTGLSPLAGPYDIAAGPDGNLWFTEPDIGGVGRITPSGTITEFFAGISPGAEPLHVAAGPDGNMWFTDYEGDRIGRITQAGAVTEFPATGMGPGRIAAGPDGNLWFAAQDSRGIGRISRTGVVTFFRAPGLGEPTDVAAGPDGHVWFSRSAGTSPERISMSGIVVLPPFPFGPALATPIAALAVAPDETVWATSPAGDRILRIVPDLPARLSIAPLTDVGRTTATVNAVIDARGNRTGVEIEYSGWPRESHWMRYAEVPAEVRGPVALSRTLTGLVPGRTYRYRVTARNGGGASAVEGTFTTRGGRSIGRLRVVPAVVATGRRAKPAKIAFDASASGIVRLEVQHIRQGRRSARGCVRPAGALVRAGAPTCVRWARTLATISRRVRAPGPVAIPFRGRVGTLVLEPGAYRLRASLPTANGGVATARFTVLVSAGGGDRGAVHR